jgi:hypothetical protein
MTRIMIVDRCLVENEVRIHDHLSCGRLPSTRDASARP